LLTCYISAFLTVLTITSSCGSKQHNTPKRESVFSEATLLTTHMATPSGNLRYHIANLNTSIFYKPLHVVMEIEGCLTCSEKTDYKGWWWSCWLWLWWFRVLWYSNFLLLHCLILPQKSRWTEVPVTRKQTKVFLLSLLNSMFLLTSGVSKRDLFLPRFPVSLLCYCKLLSLWSETLCDFVIWKSHISNYIATSYTTRFIGSS